MPSDVHILSMSASTAGIDLNITVKSKEAVADVISQLRTLDSVDITSVSTISIDKEKADVNFSVSCQYVAKVESTEEDTKEGEESTTESQKTQQNTEQASSEANTN